MGRPNHPPNYPLAELHAHLSTSISAETLWQIAHDSSFKLPRQEFVEFRDYITLSLTHKVALKEYFQNVYYPLLQNLSSGSRALEQAAYHTMTGAYHKQNITLLELRTDPLKHNKDGVFELDHVIMALLRGMERALLECKRLSAGLIFSVARDFPLERNAIVIDRAIKYKKRGVVGVDVSGPGTKSFKLKDHAPMFERARLAGLRITVHAGEAKDANDMWESLEYIKPDRIGHGILAAYDEPLMKELAKRKVVLEICPLSNLMTKAVENTEELRYIIRRFIENKVRFCINTDWPEVIEGCRLRRQFAWLRDEGLLTEDELAACNRTAFEASFIPKPGGLEAYL